MRRRNIKPKFKAKKFMVFNELLKPITLDEKHMQMTKNWKLGDKVKYKSFFATIAGIEDGTIWVVWENSDKIDSFTEKQFNFLMVKA